MCNDRNVEGFSDKLLKEGEARASERASEGEGQ